MSTNSPQTAVIGLNKADELDKSWLSELEAMLPENRPTCWNYTATRSMVLDLAREVVALRRLARHNQALLRSFRIETYQLSTECNDPAELGTMKQYMMNKLTGKE